LQNSVRFIRKRGYGIISSVFSPAELSAACSELSSAGLRRSRAGARHVLSLASVSEIARRGELLAIARAVLGRDAVPFRATFFDKSPNSNWLVAWHPDTALPLAFRRETPGWGPWSTKDGVIYAHAPAAALQQVLALRVHLDPSTAMNGPLRVIPGTHELGVLTDEEILRQAGESGAIACTVGAGGVVAMRPLVLHASSKSESEEPRRVLHIEFAASRGIGDGLRLVLV
jgi:ectoine hydroxylase-related dioxygenase (phytanoyl-CoA dioxygenase family)